MLKKLLELVTGDDNATLMPAYVWGCIAFIVGLGLEIWAVVHSRPFDMQSFGIGSGSLIALIEGGKRLGSPRDGAQ